MRSFVNFSDHDFEFFIADLLGEIDGVHYEVFARGPDQGVDLRHFTDPDEPPDVVQCKRYIRSGYSDLKRAVRKEVETLGVSGIKTSSYRLVTTLELTGANKDELAGLLTDYVSGPDDIIAAGDLETMLDCNEKVERRHPKLWLVNGVQLEAILHGATYERSRQLLEETQAALPRYVETKPFFAARERMRAEKVLVIAGPPGIGKTTLARMLLADAALDGFEPIEISADAEEANNVYKPEEPQAFYYDDFLGTTFLQDRLVKNEDKRIAQLIRRVAASSTSLFVMTTREHILGQALLFYEELEREGIEARRYLLELEEYSRLDRARIFYNHIWSSGQLDQGARDQLLDGGAYARIIDHPNYNPRLVEHITGLGSHRLSERDRDNYLDFAVDILDDPSRIWRHAFEQQLDPAQRGMLIVLSSMQSKVVLSDLRAGFRSYCEAAGIEVRGNLFDATLRVLIDSFVSTHPDEGETFIEPVNPSIVDFVASWLGESLEEALFAAEGACYFAQLEWILRSVAPNLPDGELSALLEKIAERAKELFDSGEPRWQKVHFGGLDGEVHTSRHWVQPELRLVFLSQALHDHSELCESLEGFFEERLERQSASWEEEHVIDYGNTVSLVAALLRSERPTEVTALRAKDYLLKNARGVYDWEQLERLQTLIPDLFSGEARVEVQNRFTDFASDLFATGHTEIEEVDEIDRAIALADDFGVDIEGFDPGSAREQVEERVSGREARANIREDEERLRSEYDEADDEGAAVEAVFGHLAQPQME